MYALTLPPGFTWTAALENEPTYYYVLKTIFQVYQSGRKIKDRACINMDT